MITENKEETRHQLFDSFFFQLATLPNLNLASIFNNKQDTNDEDRK